MLETRQSPASLPPSIESSVTTLSVGEYAACNCSISSELIEMSLLLSSAETSVTTVPPSTSAVLDSSCFFDAVSLSTLVQKISGTSSLESVISASLSLSDTLIAVVTLRSAGIRIPDDLLQRACDFDGVLSSCVVFGPMCLYLSATCRPPKMFDAAACPDFLSYEELIRWLSFSTSRAKGLSFMRQLAS